MVYRARDHRPVELNALLGLPCTDGGSIVATGIATDSRRVRPGDVFFARAGMNADGRSFITQAIAAGAVAVVTSPLDVLPNVSVPIFEVENFSATLGAASARLNESPSEALRLIGVTGTNGKTTVSYLLASVLEKWGGCGLIGTLGVGRPGDLAKSGHTTPEVMRTNELLAHFHANGASAAVMEVSSHGISQGRICGLQFDMAVFTNLSQDHLDYHGDMDSYWAVKAKLFEVPGLSTSIVNRDDPRHASISCPPGGKLFAYTLSGVADDSTLSVRIVSQEGPALTLEVDGPFGRGELRSRLLGRFNAYNLAAALTALGSAGHPLDEACNALGEIEPPPGRMQWLGGRGRPVVVVDYAHTPDALHQALNAITGLVRGNLWCVFGCGGDRDTHKRSQMGTIAEQFADHLIVTDDNPRTEASAKIIGDILSGVVRRDKVTVEAERARAIAHAISHAGPEDLVLVAGKGHEAFQERNGVWTPFCDVREVRGALQRYAGASS